MSIKRSDDYGTSVEVVNDPLDSIGDYLERRILIAMLNSNEFLMNMFSSYNHQFCVDAFTDGVPALIADACLKFYNRHRKAPSTELDQEIIYSRVTSKMVDDDSKDMAAGIMRSMIDQYKQDAEEYTVPKNIAVLWDQAKKFIKYRTYERCIDNLKAAQGIDNIDARLEAYDDSFGKMSKSRMVASNIVDPSQEYESLIDGAFKEQAKPLFRLPGAIGELMNSQLVPTNFVSLLAPEKRGKSWWMLEMFYRAVRSGVDTLFVQAGDMTSRQLFRRLLIRLAKRSDRERYCGELYIPTTDCQWNQCDTCEKSKRTGTIGLKHFNEGNAKRSLRNGKRGNNKEGTQFTSVKQLMDENPDYIPCNECQRNGSPDFKGAVWWRRRGPVNPIVREEARELYEDFESKLKSKFRFIEAPADTLSVEELDAHLDSMYERDGFTPQLLLLDYMDLLKNGRNGPKEFRHIQDYNWKSMRGLCQKRNLLGFVATQSDAGGFEAETLTMSNISEDKRKLSHVTSMFGLNQTWDEKRKGIMRINTIVNREDDYDIQKTVTVLQSIASGQPLIGSFFS